MNKLLVPVFAAALIFASVSCAVPQNTAAVPPDSPVSAPATAQPAFSMLSATSIAPAITAAPPSTVLPGLTLPPEYVTYSNQGWLLAVWNLSPLWVEPDPPHAGRPVSVAATIYMADIPTSFIHAELLVNGKVVDSRLLVIWFDDPISFSLSFTPDKPGVYDIAIRANLVENEFHAASSGEDLSLYSTMRLTVTE